MREIVPLRRPPTPPRGAVGTKQTLSLRVDAGIVKAFHEAAKNLGVRPSALMETILWNALGAPPMSFEPEFKLMAAAENETKPK